VENYEWHVYNIPYIPEKVENYREKIIVSIFSMTCNVFDKTCKVLKSNYVF
jgi:hypothetical protein